MPRFFVHRNQNINLVIGETKTWAGFAIVIVITLSEWQLKTVFEKFNQASFENNFQYLHFIDHNILFQRVTKFILRTYNTATIIHVNFLLFKFL